MTIPWNEVPCEIQEYVKRREHQDKLRVGATVIADEDESDPSEERYGTRWYFVRKRWGWECSGRSEDASMVPANDLELEQIDEVRENFLDHIIKRAAKVKEKTIFDDKLENIRELKHQLRVVQRYKMTSGILRDPNLIYIYYFFLKEARTIPDMQCIELCGPLIEHRRGW